MVLGSIRKLKDVLEIEGGWYHKGCKKDVPKDACYMGHYRDVYVWVCPDGLKPRSDFTRKIRSYASLLKEPTIFSTPGVAVHAGERLSDAVRRSVGGPVGPGETAPAQMPASSRQTRGLSQSRSFSESGWIRCQNSTTL